MEIFIKSLLIGLLGLIFYQDLKFRAVHWFLFPILFLVSIYYLNLNIGITQAFTFLGINLLILMLQLGLMYFYFKFKGVSLSDLFTNYIGLGDVLMFIVLCSFCSPLNYIVFFLLSLILSLVGFLLFNAFLFKKIETIPLAGLQSIILLFVFPFYHLYDDSRISKWIVIF